MTERVSKEAVEGRRFPILRDKGEVTSIPWELVEPLRAVARDVHDQSLERLAQRGGLSRWELAGLLVGVNVFGRKGSEGVLDGTESQLPVEKLIAAERKRWETELREVATRYEARPGNDDLWEVEDRVDGGVIGTTKRTAESMAAQLNLQNVLDLAAALPTEEDQRDDPVDMCACKPYGPAHPWEPGEWCPPQRIVPTEGEADA
jgi:hypothetical protein